MEDLDLADWRVKMAALYLSDADLAGFRTARDDLFAHHPQSPIPPDERGGFAGLDYFPADPTAAARVTLRPASGGMEIDTGGPDGVVRYRRVGVASVPWGALTLWWIDAYGGGLFLPFRDATCGMETYGGGRYLTDTVKGTHGRGLVLLGGDQLWLDFNYAYNPSCAYSCLYSCPLAPQENWLRGEICAGEKTYKPNEVTPRVGSPQGP